MSHDTPRLETQPREKTGTRYAKRLREQGRLPVVIYGHGHDPVHASVGTRELNDVIEHHAHIVEVAVDGAVTPCLLKDVQYDYLDRHPVHADLAIVNLQEVVEVAVGLELTSEAVGLKTSGAMLDQQLTELTVRCKASNIPDAIHHDVSELDVDQQLSVADLTLPAGVEAVDDAGTLVAQIVIQKALEEVAPEETDAAEPEVIEKGKAEDGDEE